MSEPYAVQNRLWSSLQDNEVFWMLTGETKDTLKPGRRVDAVALRVFATEVICQVRARVNLAAALLS